MKASERRLLMIFATLAVLFAMGFGTQGMRSWQHRIERREREAELAQMEATTLLSQAPMWTAKAAWLAQVQPAVDSELQGNEGLFEFLRQSALGAGLTIDKTQIEPTENSEHYRQFGVSMSVKGDLSVFMRWVHGLLAPDAFYVVPQLRIIPDKDDPTKVAAQLRVWRWYRSEMGHAKVAGT